MKESVNNKHNETCIFLLLIVIYKPKLRHNYINPSRHKFSTQRSCSNSTSLLRDWDAHTGTYYLRARNFNPSTGRFTQADSYWGIHNMQFGTDPVIRNGRLMPDSWTILQAGNLYMFVMHNPVRFLDPSGLNAILLTDTGRHHNRPNTEANPFGHTALAIQNRDTGNWYIMDFRAVPGSSNKAEIVFSQINNIEWSADGRAITGGSFLLNASLPADHQDRYGIIGRYNSQLFIEGDFQASWDMANDMAGTNPGFHFTSNNCVWQSINVLKASTVGTNAYNNLYRMLWYRPRPQAAAVKNTIIPNLAVGQVQRAMRNDFNVFRWTAPTLTQQGGIHTIPRH